MTANKLIIPFYNEYEEYGEFSNFYKAPTEYTINFNHNTKFPKTTYCLHSEQAIMAAKAVLMNDRKSYDNILKTSVPSECKHLGRQIINFDQNKWNSKLSKIAFSILYDKFNSNTILKNKLLETKDAILVEASYNDNIWGVGIDIRNKDIYNQQKWKGLNILGKILMQVRNEIKNI